MVSICRIYTLLFTLLGSIPIYSQVSIAGSVNASSQPVPYANVFLEDTDQGTFTNEEGKFLLQGIHAGQYNLIISSVGYRSTQVSVIVTEEAIDLGKINLREDMLGLEEVVITGTMNETFVSMSPVKVDVITDRYLKYSIAPTNLVESISLVNGVQEAVACGVCYTNSISINGLPGPYTAILIDGSPIYGNLASVYGLNGIPTQIIDRFEVIKGPNSTLYGSEAMAGVINIITKDPEKQPALSVDIMGTSNLESFGNITATGKVGRFTTSTGINYGYINHFDDKNNDGFGDEVNIDRLSLFSKWSMRRKSGKKFSLTGKYYFEDRRNGVEDFLTNRAYQKLRGDSVIYGESIFTNRFELFGSYQINSEEDIQLDYSYSHHDQNSYYGADLYKARQDILFTNLIWRNTFQKHQVTAGLSSRWQLYDDNTVATRDTLGNNRPDNQFIPGVFVQNEWTPGSKLTVLPGLRFDYYMKHGIITSPRLSIKVNPARYTTLRLNMGTGFKIVNLFTEDHAFVSGQREVVIAEELQPERSFNISTNLNHVYSIGESQGSLDLDIYYTHFSNKIIPNYDMPGQIIYANSEGNATTKGISASISHQFTFPMAVNFSLNLQDASQRERNAANEWVEQPIEYASAWSGVGTLNYRIPGSGLTFAYTGRLMGPMQLPEVFDLDENGVPLGSPRDQQSVPYSLHNIQVTKDFESKIGVYVGVSNIFNYIQPVTPLTGFDDPNSTPGFSPYFDTSYNFAPSVGREVYLGARFSIQ